MNVLGRVRRFVRACLVGLLEDDDSNSIKVSVGGDFVDLTAVGVSGLCLVCEGNRSERLVRVVDAVDRRRFAKLWRRLGGRQPTWPDGTPCDLFS